MSAVAVAIRLNCEVVFPSTVNFHYHSSVYQFTRSTEGSSRKTL